MEVGGQQEKEIGMPSSLGNYNPINRESPSKLSSASSIISTVSERRRDANSILNPSQTLDHDHLYHHHQFNLQQQQQQKHIQGRDPNPDPDPAPIAVAGATSAIPIASGSNSKSPAVLPVPVPAPPAAAAAPPPINSATTTIRYRECLKNHAANKGGHAVDGCGEFMPTGDEGTPEALKCAACDCHRNFHRKEIDGESQYNANCQYNPNKDSNRRNKTIQPYPQFPTSSLITPPQQPSSHLHHHQTVAGPVLRPTMMMGFGGGVAAESSSEDLNVFDQSNVVGGVQPSSAAHNIASFSGSKKRFRTKFSQEQKDKMLGFAEKLGWKIQKQDEEEVHQFCSQVGVRRQVFKVWMHNNKQAIKKKE